MTHEWANGNRNDLSCGANMSTVCEGNEYGAKVKMYSYSTPIASRQVINSQAVFIVTTRKYSITTSRHKRCIDNCIPLELNIPFHLLDNDKYKTNKKEECAYTLIQEEFKKLRKDKQLSVVYYVPAGIGSETQTYNQMCNEVLAKLNDLRNPRIKRYAKHEAMQVFVDHLMAEDFRKTFKLNCKAFRYPNPIKKTISAYIQKIDIKRQKQINQVERRLALTVTKCIELLPQLKELSAQWQEAIQVDIEAWRNHEEEGTLEKVRNRLSFEIKDKILMPINLGKAEPDKILSYDLLQQFEIQAGYCFYGNDRIGSALRLASNGKDIETNRQARVPVTLCKALFKRFKAKVLASAKEEEVEGLPIAIGSFNWVASAKGVMQIGCHKIEANEILRLADKLEW